jgi:putative phosphoribosyl transferase
MQIVKTQIQIGIKGDYLVGDLNLPEQSSSVVLFAHGSGSSRLSPRNQFVASELNKAGFATLLMDLLTAQEEAIDMHDARLRFDINLLAERVSMAMRWLTADKETSSMSLGLFGASTGSAAALVAAAENQLLVEAIVSRGGRPDLAGDYLATVKAPTLLIVGGLDRDMIGLNTLALKHMSCTSKIDIVPGATHLFQETGTLEQVARLAIGWFTYYMTPPAYKSRHTTMPVR